jgi:hypothetical protein
VLPVSPHRREVRRVILLDRLTLTEDGQTASERLIVVVVVRGAEGHRPLRFCFACGAFGARLKVTLV